jgi:hypothetical protein
LPGTLLLKIVLAAGFPITGIEGVFTSGVCVPYKGYSDHPPMGGLVVRGITHISDAPLVLRSVTCW